MITPAKNDRPTTENGRRRRGGLIAIVVGSGLAVAGVVGAAHFDGKHSAFAQERYSKPSQVQTPYGPAPLSFADIVDRVKPAVVSVHVKNGKKAKGLENPFKGLPELPEDHPFNEFFKKFRKGPNAPKPVQAQGSGFIISADGYIVTNHHVVGEASEISVTMDNGDKLDATLVGSDQRTDLALLKIKSPRKFDYVEFAKKEARVGDWVLAVGNPFGLGGTVTAGIVSARGRDIGQSPYDYLQIDAAVNRGNSGGPALNLDGDVVGVNTAIWSPSGGNVGIAFAVPSDLAQSVIRQLKRDGSVSRGWLGVTIQNVSEDIAASIGLPEPYGALVTKINAGGPASRSEIQVGDAIVSVNGERIDDSRDLARTVADLHPGDRAEIAVYREGRRQKISVKLGRFPGMKKLAKLEQGAPIGEEMEDLGLSLAPANTRPGAGDVGVVITDVDPGAKAAEKGLKTGDVILKVDGKSVYAPEDVVNGVKRAKGSGRKAVLLWVRSNGRERFIGLPLKAKKG